MRPGSSRRASTSRTQRGSSPSQRSPSRAQSLPVVTRACGPQGPGRCHQAVQFLRAVGVMVGEGLEAF